MSGAVAVRYTATIEPCFDAALAVWETMAREGGALPFQSRSWLSAWTGTVGRGAALDLLPVTISDAAGAPVAGLPLVRERRGLRRIGFADGGLADYNAPILGRAAPEDRAGAAALWRALLPILPAADVLRFERMPRVVGSRLNPFALLPAARPSSAIGLALTLAQGYAGWLAARPRRYRMELGRCGRHFDALPGARFEQVAAPYACDALDALDRLQRARVADLALPYALDDPGTRAFHEALATDRDAGALFCLRAEDRIMAVLFGLRVGAGFVMLRVSADPAYARLSPSRLVIARAIAHLAGEGVRFIDFGIGDYAYKRRLGGEPIELVDVVAARSPRGMPELADHRARAALRTRPRTRAVVRRLRELVRSPRFRPTAAS